MSNHIKFLLLSIILSLICITESEIIKAFHIDNGRKYFSVDELKDMIDVMAKNNFNALELAIGNDGFRFLLDDMTMDSVAFYYESEEVKKAINEGNKKYAEFEVNELTETEMNTIIKYANDKGIEIIPLIDTPGHMDAILYACTTLTGQDCSYHNSKRTIDVTNQIATEFTIVFVKKFAQYFKEKGSTMFNMGGDEYANDIYTSGSMGFGHLIEEGKYNYFIDYINAMSDRIKTVGLKPVAFNDGFYFNENTSFGEVDKDILVSYWSAGWGQYHLCPASKLKDMGYKFLNTNGNWYYVLNWPGIGGNSFDKNTVPGIKKNPYDTVIGTGTMNVEGCMLCFWCDRPTFEYNDKEKGYLHTMIELMAEYNPDVF